MTAIRIYGLIWLLVLGVTGVSYLMGFINAITFPIFGFVFSTLAVGGSVAVLPAWLNEHYSPKTYPVPKKVARNQFDFRPAGSRAKHGRTTFRRRGHHGVHQIPDLNIL
jgi:hypothetical protein